MLSFAPIWPMPRFWEWIPSLCPKIFENFIDPLPPLVETFDGKDAGYYHGRDQDRGENRPEDFHLMI
jgi:hypothetical protein